MQRNAGRTHPADRHCHMAGRSGLLAQTIATLGVRSARSVTANEVWRASAAYGCGQPVFGDPAGDSKRGVEDVADIVADDLPHQMAGSAGVQPVILGEPAQHLGGGVLQRLIERPRIADGEDILRGLAARPGDRPLQDAERNFHLERGFDAGADDLTIALAGVAVAKVEQRARHRYREPGSRPRRKQTIVHVAAVLRTGCGGQRLAERRRDPEAADHGLEWRREGFEALRRFAQPHGPSYCRRSPRQRAAAGAGRESRPVPAP